MSILDIAKRPTWLQRLFCRHGLVRVIRHHARTVRPDMQGKQLYVDRHRVHNFVQCCHCGCILKTKQFEPIYEQRQT